MFITLPLALIILSPSSQFIAGFAELIILPQSPSFSTSPPSSAVSVVSQTHSSYGSCGTLGLCYILPYKQPNHHPQHARNFPLSFYLLCIFLLIKMEQTSGFKSARTNIFLFLWESQYCFPRSSTVFTRQQFTGNLVRTVILVKGSSVKEEREWV